MGDMVSGLTSFKDKTYKQYYNLCIGISIAKVSVFMFPQPCGPSGRVEMM